jgi:hypothetical protein
VAIVPGTNGGRVNCVQEETRMRSFRLLTALVLGLASVIGPAIGAEWQRLVIMGTGTSVEIPVSIFTEETELPDGGIGRRL